MAPKQIALQLLFRPRWLFFPASYENDLAHEVAYFAFDRREDYDLILLTGDIATTGLTEDLEPAFEFVDAPAVMGWRAANHSPTLQGANRRIFLLPGNHDRYASNFGHTGGQTFDTVFQKYWRNSTKRVQRLVIPKASDNERLALVAADFTLARERHADVPFDYYRYGQGRAYPWRVKRLVDATERTRREFEKVAVVWVLHFPPLQSSLGKLDLIDAELVREAAVRLDVPLILAGHVHRSIDHESDGVRVWCAGSPTSVDAKHGNCLHMLEFEVSNGILNTMSRTDYYWDQTIKEFVP